MWPTPADRAATKMKQPCKRRRDPCLHVKLLPSTKVKRGWECCRVRAPPSMRHKRHRRHELSCPQWCSYRSLGCVLQRCCRLWKTQHKVPIGDTLSIFGSVLPLCFVIQHIYVLGESAIYYMHTSRRPAGVDAWMQLQPCQNLCQWAHTQ